MSPTMWLQCEPTRILTGLILHPSWKVCSIMLHNSQSCRPLLGRRWYVPLRESLELQAAAPQARESHGPSTAITITSMLIMDVCLPSLMLVLCCGMQ